MLEVDAVLYHLSPDAVWLSIYHFHSSLLMVGSQNVFNLVDEGLDDDGIVLLIFFKLLFQLVVFYRAAVFESQVLHLNLNL